MPVESGTIAPVVKEVTVPLPVERAWQLFTAEAASWWPLRTHSVAGDDAIGCTFQAYVGGRLYETARDGTEHTWGTLLEWQPPLRFAMTWHPGRTPSTEQHLEVTFTPADDGRSTTVRLVHTGWEKLGKAGPDERDSYLRGWDYVLGFFTAAAAGDAPAAS
ncbi:MAG TPA: SRPBCC domain-containing protein [Candidatus Limnocylindrales bacterium]|jgi:uncharacterized protein YndB with AHSA1/START domain